MILASRLSWLNSDIHLRDVVLRCDQNETNPKALHWVNGRRSYCNFLPNHSYHLNLNFCGKEATEAITKKIEAGYMFRLFILRKLRSEQPGIMSLSTCAVNWLNGVEAGPDANEKSKGEKYLAEVAKNAAEQKTDRETTKQSVEQKTTRETEATTSAAVNPVAGVNPVMAFSAAANTVVSATTAPLSLLQELTQRSAAGSVQDQKGLRNSNS